jgi:hypothetical protein
LPFISISGLVSYLSLIVGNTTVIISSVRFCLSVVFGVPLFLSLLRNISRRQMISIVISNAMITFILTLPDVSYAFYVRSRGIYNPFIFFFVVKLSDSPQIFSSNYRCNLYTIFVFYIDRSTLTKA